MTAVLNGFRERAEKVAAVIAECRRLGIDVRPPDVQKSPALFTVETDADGAPEAIRFGLAAIKNVGEGAIEAIVAARDGGEEPGPVPLAGRPLPARGPADGQQARHGVAHQGQRRGLARDRRARSWTRWTTRSRTASATSATWPPGSSRCSTSSRRRPGDESVQFLDGGEEIPRRERLRWEKELIGLYLSEHPLGDIAAELPDYVTAYTGELAEEPDQAKVTIGGILISSRRVITRAGSTMLVATLEDLQGSVEVVVFPKVFEQTAQSWADDNVVLVSGRIDRRDESPQILCEAVHAWDDAVRMGPVAFSAERDRLLAARGGNGRRWDRPPQPERAPIPVEAPVPRLRWQLRRSVRPSRWRRRPRRPMPCRSSRRPSRPPRPSASRSATTCRPSGSWVSSSRSRVRWPVGRDPRLCC